MTNSLKEDFLSAAIAIQRMIVFKHIGPFPDHLHININSLEHINPAHILPDTILPSILHLVPLILKQSQVIANLVVDISFGLLMSFLDKVLNVGEGVLKLVG